MAGAICSSSTATSSTTSRSTIPKSRTRKRKKLYRNTGQGHFVDATKSQGDDFRAPRVGRGLAVGDYDNDGWQDFLVSNNGEDAQLFHNDGASRSGREKKSLARRSARRHEKQIATASARI